MGPVLDLKRRKETTMEASISEDHIAVLQMPKDKNMRSEGEICKNEEVEVDIINCMPDDDDDDDDEGGSVQLQSEDATGSSSSFGDTFSKDGYGSDDEVMSGLRVDAAPMRGFGGSGDLFPPRKKRLTSHWRKFIQPIMWRCKWVELQIKKFQSQAIKYDKQLKKTDGNFELVEGLCAKSMPFSHNSQREKLMKRKKRKRHEESNTEVYMAQHNLFSYFATRRSTVGNGGATMDDDQTNLATSTDKNVNNEFRVPNELLSLEFRDDYFLEQMLWKIEVAQSQVCEMKTRLNTVMTENSGRFEELNLIESNNPLTSSVKEPGSPRNRDGSSVAALIASELMKYNTGDDPVKPENATSSHGEETQIHDINEQMEQPSIASRKRSTDGILIYNRRAKKSQMDSGSVKIHPIEKLQQPKEEKAENTARVSVSEDSSQNEQPAPKLRSVSKLTAPNNKKKRAARARRKGGSSLWSRRTSG